MVYPLVSSNQGLLCSNFLNSTSHAIKVSSQTISAFEAVFESGRGEEEKKTGGKQE